MQQAFESVKKLEQLGLTKLSTVLKGPCALNNPSVEVCTQEPEIKRIKEQLNIVGDFLTESMRITHCDTEACVIEKTLPNYKAYIQKHFLPYGPIESGVWLSNFNIDDFLEQLERKYPYFKNLGFHMSNYLETSAPYAITVTKVNISNMKDIQCFGCVFNTDTYQGSGRHWFAVFCDLRQNCVFEYFNSVPGSLPQYISKLFAIWSTTVPQHMTISKRIVSSVDHQTDNSSCGIYSLIYILSRVIGISANAFETNVLPSHHMQNIRSLMFTPKN